MSEEIKRLKKELTRAQADRELLREEKERERAEKRTLWIDLRKLRSLSHRTSSDQESIQQWQDRAEKAEERAETAERELIKFRDVNLTKFRDTVTRAIVEATEIFLPKNEGEIPSHSQQPPPRQPPSGEAISPSDRISRLSSELRRVRAREKDLRVELEALTRSARERSAEMQILEERNQTLTAAKKRVRSEDSKRCRHKSSLNAGVDLLANSPAENMEQDNDWVTNDVGKSLEVNKITNPLRPRLVARVQRRLSIEKDTTAVTFERADPRSVRSRRDSTGPNQEAQSDLQPKSSSRDDALPRLSNPRASTEGSAFRALEYPSSQQQPLSRQVGPFHQFNAEHHPSFPHETTSAVKERALKLGGPSNLPKYVSPRLLPHSSPLPEIPAASTTSAVPESSQTETQSFRGQWPGAEPAEAQPADRNREVNSLTIEMTGNSDQDDEQTPDTNITYVAASKRPKGIPAAVSRTRGKYWPRGRI